MMKSRDFLDIKHDSYLISVNLPEMQPENIVITSEKNELRVRATSKKVSVDMDVAEISGNVVVFDKTWVLEDANFKDMTHVFLYGLLEITVPKLQNTL